MNFDISIIIACFNEEGILEKSVKEIRAVMAQTIYSYEIIFIDDYSKDKTKNVILKIVENNPNMRYVFHEKNIGRGGTVMDGIKIAKGRIVGFLDIDLEVHARYIPSMIQAINQGYDIANGYRFYNIKLNLVIISRHILSVSYRRLARFLLGVPLKDTETGYKFFLREKILPIVDKIKNKGWFWDTEIMATAYYSGLKIKEIPCLFSRRIDKKTSVRVFKDSFDYLVELYEFKKKISKGENRGVIYWQPKIYQWFMKLIYGNNFEERYKAIAEYIPRGVGVIDVCCGDCSLYHNYLKFKDVDYLGLDINPAFVGDALKKNVKARLFDIKNTSLPKAEYVIMQASLYQFIPGHNKILSKLFNSATKGVIISEPICNLSTSRNKIVSWAAKAFAKICTGSTVKRFDEKSLMEVFLKYGGQLKTNFKIQGGREMIGVFEIKENVEVQKLIT